MKDKTLKKLKRAELLELLLEQRRINEQLEKELAEAKEQLEDKKIRIQGAGNLAEASLALTEVFREAQKAADLYLENVKKQAQEPPERVRQAASAISGASEALNEAAGDDPEVIDLTEIFSHPVSEE